jgi:hypothetical protein
LSAEVGAALLTDAGYPPPWRILKYISRLEKAKSPELAGSGGRGAEKNRYQRISHSKFNSNCSFYYIYNQSIRVLKRAAGEGK